MVSALIFLQPVTGTAEETAAVKDGQQMQQTMTYAKHAPTSSAYMRMQTESARMIKVMAKSIILVQKRIEVAKKKDDIMCIECMEQRLPMMQSQLKSAMAWDDILTASNKPALDHLEAYWAIQDSYKAVKKLKDQSDRYWRWKLSF